MLPQTSASISNPLSKVCKCVRCVILTPMIRTAQQHVINTVKLNSTKQFILDIEQSSVISMWSPMLDFRIRAMCAYKKILKSQKCNHENLYQDIQEQSPYNGSFKFREDRVSEQ